MKKTIFALLVVCMILLSIPAFAADYQSIRLDLEKVNSGTVGISALNVSNETLIVQVRFNGVSSYYYFNDNGETMEVPLNSGDGQYRIAVLEKNSAGSYKFLFRQYVEVEIQDEFSLYLSSNSEIKWEKEDEAIIFANELVKDLKTDREKIDAIYNYILKNYSYDYAKRSRLSGIYVPDIKDTFETEKGICYDFSVLYASMLRSQGIPAKLIKGESDLVNGYHAWNEVYLEDEDEWVVIDLTLDIFLNRYNIKFNQIKPSSNYYMQSEF